MPSSASGAGECCGLEYAFWDRIGGSGADNNSTDQTHDVVEAFSRQHPGRFRYLFEPRPGKSCALNAGIAGAKGDTVAFMDDDVTVSPEWLWNLVAPLPEGGLAGRRARLGRTWSFRGRSSSNMVDFESIWGLRPTMRYEMKSEFARRLLRAGERLYYVPFAVVYHPVTEDRLSKKYFLTWWFDKGRSEMRESGIPRDGGWMIGGIPLNMFRRLAR